MSPVLDLDPYYGLSGLSVQQETHVQHPGTDIGSSGLYWGEKEQTLFMHVPLMTGTVLTQNPRILASEGNPASYVQADGNNNMSSVLTG